MIDENTINQQSEQVLMTLKDLLADAGQKDSAFCRWSTPAYELTHPVFFIILR